MSSDRSSHLEDDQLLLAVVDEADLPQPLREHLSTCLQCREIKEQIGNDLIRLGQMAKRLSPSPRKGVSFPVEKPLSSSWWSWEWKVVLGVAAAAVFVMLVMNGPAFFKTIPERSDIMRAQEMLEAEEFLQQISMLLENSLPQVYLDITGESDIEFDEEFMDFIVPTVENESLSYDSWGKGVELC